jgi:hypothetical protein
MAKYICMNCKNTLWFSRGKCIYCGSEKIHFCSL